MQAKLTLTIDPQVMREARRYAKQSGTSVSAIVENYLRVTLSHAARELATVDVPITPTVAHLQGIAQIANQDIDANPMEEWHDYLEKKYV